MINTPLQEKAALQEKKSDLKVTAIIFPTKNV